MRQTIHGELYSEDFKKLDQLIKDWCSAYRFAFCRFQKDNLLFNDIRNKTKEKYTSINTRQVSDAVMQAQGLYIRIGNRKVIFGSRKVWNKLIKKEIDTSHWRNVRDNQIYSRGDKTHNGNPNIRILNNKELRVTVGNRQFVEYKLFIPNKFQKKLDILLKLGIAYNIRLIKKVDKKIKVIIDYELENPIHLIDFTNGIIGIDTNPDKIAVCEVNNFGQYLSSFSIVNNKLYFADTNKRDYEIGCIVNQIIEYAIKVNKGISFENLKFKKEFVNEGKKFNRTKSTFTWKKFITLLERKCIEHGIMYRKVHPAFTSIIGKIKYQKMYNVNVHESAAYVIARRGLCLNEKLSVYQYSSDRVKKVVLDIVGDRTVKFHSWKLWRVLKDNYKTVLTALQTGISNLKELESNVCYGGEIPSS